MPNRYNGENIDDLFRDSLGSGERMPAAPVWQKIEAELDNDKRRKFLLWCRPIVAAVGVLLIAGLYFRNPDGNLIRRTVFTAKPAQRSANHPLASTKTSGNLPEDQTVQKASHMALLGKTSGGQGPGNTSDALSTLPRATPPEAIASPRTGGKVIVNIPGNKSLPGGLVRAGTVRHPFYITAYISQELAGYNLADHDSTNPQGREVEKRQGTSFSRSVGVLVTYPLASRWLIESGIGLSRSITIGNPGKTVAVQDNNGKVSFLVNTVTGYGYVASTAAANLGDSATTGKVTGELDYVSIPLNVDRKWTIRRLDVLAGAGLSANLLTHATIRTSIAGQAGADHQQQVAQYGLRKVTYGWAIKSELRYRLSRVYAASMIATFKNAVGPVNVHTAYSTYPYNFGIGVGVTRTF